MKGLFGNTLLGESPPNDGENWRRSLPAETLAWSASSEVAIRLFRSRNKAPKIFTNAT
jgi:hypothetical protein